MIEMIPHRRSIGKVTDMHRILRAAGLGLCLATPAFADDAGMAKTDAIMVHDGWARASIGKAPNSAAYMTLMAHGDTADRLIAVSTPLADKAELHNHVLDDGIAKMRQVEAIEISPDEPAALEPGGLHIMLIGLKQALEEGTDLPLTLVFENAGDVTLEVPILGMKDARQRGGDQKHSE